MSLCETSFSTTATISPRQQLSPSLAFTAATPLQLSQLDPPRVTSDTLRVSCGKIIAAAAAAAAGCGQWT